MRRTRPAWQYALFSVPVLFVAAGLTYFSKHHGNSGSSSNSGGARTVASVKGKVEDGTQLQQMKQKVKDQIADLDRDQDAPEQDLKETTTGRTPASAAASGACASEEFPGKGPESVKPTEAQWEAVMKEFHAAKGQVTTWLKTHKSQFSEKTYQWMLSRVSDAQLVRPPSENVPDLSWRGIGYSQPPLIRVGGGMIKWVAEKPQRARFELARLLAQSWAPCEVAKVDTTAPWKELVSCLDLTVEADPAKACGPGSYSEAGWAVSSVVAAAASPPGCRIPAFDKLTTADCMKKMGVNL